MAISLIQTTSGSLLVAGGTMIGTFSSNVTAGNAIIGALAINGTKSLTSINDTLGNGYGSIGGTVTTNGVAFLFYAGNVTGGSTIGTFVVSGAANMGLIMREYSGLDISPLDVFSSGTNALGTPVNCGTTAITSMGSELVIAIEANNAGRTITAAGGFGNAVSAIDPANIGAGMEDKIISSIGAQSGTMNLNSSSTSIGIVATFKAAGIVAKPNIAFKSLLGVGNI